MLDVILKKLHGRHRVLIFSQMTRVLDVLVRTTWSHGWLTRATRARYRRTTCDYATTPISALTVRGRGGQ
jgi:hypothetical protein